MKRHTTKNIQHTTNDKQLCAKYHTVDQIVDILFENRGIKTKKERADFFNPPNPSEMTAKEFNIDDAQIKVAVKRIKKAIENKDKIVVYGDYDVDGICATAILWETLYSLGASVIPYIPSRFTEGYGLNVESIKKLKEDNPELVLMITVDQGIVAHEKVKFAKDLGLDVIITDHHEPSDTKPDALAIVHTTKISGSGVSWVLSRELSDMENDHLGLAALGTITDLLPLVGINRSIAVHGLDVLRSSQRAGIKAICKEAFVEQKTLETYHIGFILGPRLNAMGRVEHAMDSLRLLCTKNPERAADLAFKLGRTNKLRQEKTEATFNHVHESFGASWSNGNLPKLLFVHHETYEEGIIGIAAGRLVDKYYRPAIVVSRGEEFSKASARSIPGVNIIDLIREAGEGLLVNTGGHPMAAGFTVKTEDLEILGQRLFKISQKTILDNVLTKETKIDCEIGFSGINWDLCKALSVFTPFGYGNPEPTFLTKNVNAAGVRLMGKDNTHLKLQLIEKGAILPAVGFRMGEIYPKLTSDKLIDVVYSIEQNEWQGKREIQLKLRNIKVQP